jgi:callose synthase
MALQEGCFVTLTQRVLWDPLRVRLHYGHPDVFDKIYSMTRGGVSKASRGINLSEDIYAGFNHLLRGSTIPYIEYVQVGKGRDVGMQQIYKFEAKLASGNAEQCLSRDVYRIGQRLDFTRLLSFYYSGPGFYFNNAATVFAMFAFLYLQLWSHILQLDAGVPAADLLNAQWVLQLGLLLTVPILCYLAVEHGPLHSIEKFVKTFLTGSPFFFMFHMGTKAHYYDSTLKYGGAKYRPTGRGFVMEHENFAELYRFHAGSHLYNGFELLWGLLLLMSLTEWGAATYWRTTWSLWAVMISWIYAPFWFNPLAFDQSKFSADCEQWLLWMQRKDGSPLTSWEAWYEEEHGYLETGSWVKRWHIFAPAVRYSLTFVGLLGALSERQLHEGVLFELQVVGTTVGGIAALLMLFWLLRWLFRDSPFALRVGSTFLLIAAFIALPILLSRVSIFQVLLFVAACGYFLAAAVRIPFMINKPRSCILAMQAYDYLCGGLLLGLCWLCSVPEFCRKLQTKSLLSAVFERRVAHNEIMGLLSADN